MSMQNRVLRFGVIFTVLAIVATACGSDGEADTAAVTTTAAGGLESDSALRRALLDTGVTIVDEPGEGGPVDSMQFLTFQVDNMEREVAVGSGYLGVELDDLFGAPGGLPFSYLLAGWINTSETPAGRQAGAIMGEQSWSEAPSLTFPTAVLALFVADVVAAGEAARGTANGAEAMARVAQSGVCSTMTKWASDALDYIVDVLTFDTEGNWFREYLGAAWNFAVGLAADALKATVKALTEPIVTLLKDILFVAAVATKVWSVLNPWSLQLTASRPTTRFAVGGEEDIKEHFIAEVDTNVDVTWNRHILDCATVIGMPLPDPSTAVGSEIVWLASGLRGEGTVVSKEEIIRSNDTARLDWITGREESDEGDPFPGRFAASVTVINDHGPQLKLLIEGFIIGQIPDIPIASGVLRKGVLTITEPILSKIVDYAQVRGVIGVDVIYHIPQDGDDPDDNGRDEGDGGDDGRAGLIRIDIGRATRTGMSIGGEPEVRPFTGHPDFTIWVSPSGEDCRLQVGSSFDDNAAGCSFTIEDGPAFLVGKRLTTDSIATGDGDARYYSWIGLENLDDMFGFVGVTRGWCLDAPWYFRIFENGVTVGFPDGLNQYFGSEPCVTILTSATTEYTTDP
jgi:hypothetical protein